MSEAGVYAFNYTVGIHEYISGEGRTLAVLETLLSLRLDTVEESFPLMFSYPPPPPPPVYRLFPTFGRQTVSSPLALRGTARDVAPILKASVNTVSLVLPYGHPLEWSVESSFRGEIGERSTSRRRNVHRPTPD